MNRNFLFFMIQAPCIVFAVTAGIMAIRGVGGWGWVLVVSLLCAHSVKTNNDD